MFWENTKKIVSVTILLFNIKDFVADVSWEISKKI